MWVHSRVHLLQLSTQTPQDELLDWIGMLKNKPLHGNQHRIHCKDHRR